MQIEQESAVLLKNEDNILPLNEKQNVVFVGEYSQGFPAEGDQENEDWVKAAVEAAKQAQTALSLRDCLIPTKANAGIDPTCVCRIARIS